ncbi:hypothetical protein AgCh_040083 [Apium graveolens]
MSPGRRTTRSIARNQKEILTNDTNVCTIESKGDSLIDAKTIEPSAKTPLAGENVNKTRAVNPRKATRGMGTSRIAKASATERAVKNTINRSKRPWESKNGSVSTTRHHIRRGMELTSSTGQIETWRLNHFDKNGWTGPGLQELYDKMIDIRESHSPEEMSDKEIMEAVLGRDFVHLRGWGRSGGKTNKRACGTTIESNQPSYQELVQQLNEANNRLDEVINVLRQNNLMAPPKTSPINDDLDANLNDLF